MDMDDRVVARQARQQRAERGRGLFVPDSLNGGARARGMAQNIVLAETDGLYAGVGEFSIHRPDGGKEDRPRARLFQPQRAFDGDLGLSASDRGVIDADHHGEGGGGFQHCGARWAGKPGEAIRSDLS